MKTDRDNEVRRKLVVIEDDRNDRLLLAELLDQGHLVDLELVEAETAEAGKALIDDRVVCALIDNLLPDGYGLELVSELRAAWPQLAIIMLTGTGDEEIAVEALRRGADNYIPKSRLTAGKLLAAIETAIDQHRLTAVMQHEQAQLALLSQLSDSAEDLLFVVDVRREAIVMGNAAVRRALNRPDQNLSESPAPVAHLFKAGDASWRALRSLLDRSSPARFETTVWIGHYIGRPMEISARMVLHEGRQFTVCIGRDVSERRSIQSDLLRQASIDPQTDLPTASAFLLQFTALARSAGEDWLLAAIHLSAVEAATRDISPEVQADWRRRIAELLGEAVNSLGGCAGVVSSKTFVLACPLQGTSKAKAALDDLQAAIAAQLKALPRSASDHSAPLPRLNRAVFGGLTGAADQLATLEQLAVVQRVAADAEHAGRQMLKRLTAPDA